MKQEDRVAIKLALRLMPIPTLWALSIAEVKGELRPLLKEVLNEVDVILKEYMEEYKKELK